MNEITLQRLYEDFAYYELLPLIVEFGDYTYYSELWNDIIDHDFGGDFRGCAWVTRSGRVWTCGWAKHEQLLHVMGLKIEEVEQAGWLRISQPLGSAHTPKGYICNRVSPKQRAFAKRHDVTLYEMNEDDPIVKTLLIEAYENMEINK